MSEAQQHEKSAESSEEDQAQPKTLPNSKGGRKPANLAMQKAATGDESAENDAPPSARIDRRIGPVRESRITDRPPKVGEKDSSLKIKIELDLEVEVEIYARVKGDVTIGLLTK